MRDQRVQLFSLLAMASSVVNAATTPAVVPRVIVSADSSWGTAADNWAGYTGALNVWVPSAVSGGWTLKFKSPELGKQVQAGGFWNATGSYDPNTQVFTLTSPSWAGNVAANSILNLGFNGNGALNTAITIENCTFNQQPCVASAMSSADAKTTLAANQAGFVAAGGTPASTTVVPAPQPADTSTGNQAVSGSSAAFEVLFSVSSEWSGGYAGNVVLKNLSGKTLPAGASGWKARIKFPDMATAKDVFQSGPWNLDAQFGTDGTVTLVPKAWAAALGAGDVVSTGFNGGHAENIRKASSIDQGTTVLFSASAASTTPTPVDPVVDPAPSVPIVPVDGNIALPTGQLPGGLQFSPYKDALINMNWNTFLMSSKLDGTVKPLLSALPSKVPAVTWAFATGECGNESWGGIKPQDMAAANVGAFVKANRNYIISTGGAAGAFHCSSVTGMRTFINRYASQNLVGVDFDIEAGQSAANIDSLVEQVAAVQGDYPGLRFSFTIATLGSSNGGAATAPYGDLNATGANVLKSLQKFPVNNYTINLMVMDYGPAGSGVCVASNGVCDMGQTAIQAAKNLKARFGIPYNRIELTPMIGRNDVTDEIFSLKDTDTMISWAKANGIAGLHFWSVDRDTPCDNSYASPICSSITEVPVLGYSQRFVTDLGL